MTIQDAVANYSATDTAVVTTTETVAITTPLMRINRNSAIVMIAAWAQLLLGTATTTVTPRIRRGDAITDTIVVGSDTIAIQSAVATNAQYQLIGFAQPLAEQVLRYSLTLAQVSATANGTIVQAGIFAIAV
jgi:hypothetical protein